MLTNREKTWKSAFIAMSSLLKSWKNNDPDLCRRLPTRIFYEAVGNTKTGYKSQNAINNPSMTTDDHFAVPQWIGRFIMDNGDVYLSDFEKLTFQNFEKFKKICIFASQTIKVTKEENIKLSSQTSIIAEIDGINTFIKTPIKDKYDKAGILLWCDKDGYVDEFPIDIPQEILDYEEQFLKK